MDDILNKKALEYHSMWKAGKTEVTPTKPFGTAQELSMAYTPGVAAPAAEINEERWKAYRYTNKGNLIAVISNGSSVLGLGNIGALASKPVMEGKAMLFKIYADIDAFDIELSDEEPDKFIATVQALAPTFGGINLEDIKAPECFYIEEKLRRLLDIPVLHDDQHGTAVTIAAAFINACEVTGKEIGNTSIVICGAGAAAISTARMLLHIGVNKEQITMVDSKGVLNRNRNDTEGIKSEFVSDNKATTLKQAIKGSDAFIGLSRGNLIDEEDIRSMAAKPIIFALANPVPEIDYKKAKATRPDAVVATGRSDIPNQINNVLAFPYLFRGALDTLATNINEEMEIAAVHAIARLAHEPVPECMQEKYEQELSFGSDYLLPKPGDRRLLTEVSSAVAKAAIKSGIARRNILSFKEYADTLLARTDNGNFFARESIRHRSHSRMHPHTRKKEF